MYTARLRADKMAALKEKDAVKNKIVTMLMSGITYKAQHSVGCTLRNMHRHILGSEPFDQRLCPLFHNILFQNYDHFCFLPG